MVRAVAAFGCSEVIVYLKSIAHMSYKQQCFKIIFYICPITSLDSALNMCFQLTTKAYELHLVVYTLVCNCMLGAIIWAAIKCARLIVRAPLP